MLRYSLKLDEEAAAIEAAVDRIVSAGKLTVDLGGSLTTRQVSDEIIANLN